MNRNEMISYAKQKGYDVNYSNYCFNDNIPYIVINNVCLYIAKRNNLGLTADANFSKVRFNAFEYFCKNYYNFPYLPEFGERVVYDFCDYDYDKIREINNTTTPWFAQEHDFIEKLDYDVYFGGLCNEDVPRFFDLRREIFKKKNSIYKKI